MYKDGDNITWQCNISGDQLHGIIERTVIYNGGHIYKVKTDKGNRWVSEDLIISSN